MPKLSLRSMRAFLRNTIIAGFTLSIAGCSSTVIKTVPPGAKVYVEDSYRGVTPYTYKDSKIVFSRTYFRLEKEGYQPFTISLTRDEKAQVVPIIGGALVLFPFIWTLGYDSEHIYELRPVSTNTVNAVSASN